MTSDPSDLTGVWLGRYDYAGGIGAPVAFECELTQLGLSLSGSVIEPNTFATRAGPELTAEVDGHVMEDGVEFRKTYHKVSQPDDPTYSGSITRSGDRIEGTWSFRKWPWIKGTFSMTRKRKAKSHIKRETDVTVDA